MSLNPSNWMMVFRYCIVDRNRLVELKPWSRTAVFSLFGNPPPSVLLALPPRDTMWLGISDIAAGGREERRSQPETGRYAIFAGDQRGPGLQSCSTVFPVLGEPPTNGTTYSVRSIWKYEVCRKTRRGELWLGMNFATEGYSGPAAGVVFAASGPHGQLAKAQSVRWRRSPPPAQKFRCDASEKKRKFANNLGQISIYELANDGGNAMLLPTGNTCVVISVASAAGKQGSAR